MLLNSIPQIYEVIVTTLIDENTNCASSEFNVGLESYLVSQSKISYISNTISYTLYFADMISKTKFLNKLPKSQYTYCLKGLVYFETVPHNLEAYVNG